MPRQNNGYDCGVFVCRYAYSIFQLRDRRFTFGDANLLCASECENERQPFYNLITEQKEFDFNMTDIARFRTEFKTLIERLSTIYLELKKREKAEKKKQKAASSWLAIEVLKNSQVLGDFKEQSIYACAEQ